MGTDQERISLSPLHPIEALKALLKVDPESEPVEADESKDEAAAQPDETSD